MIPATPSRRWRFRVRLFVFCRLLRRSLTDYDEGKQQESCNIPHAQGRLGSKSTRAIQAMFKA